MNNGFIPVCTVFIPVWGMVCLSSQSVIFLPIHCGLAWLIKEVFHHWKDGIFYKTGLSVQ